MADSSFDGGSVALQRRGTLHLPTDRDIAAAIQFSHGTPGIERALQQHVPDGLLVRVERAGDEFTIKISETRGVAFCVRTFKLESSRMPAAASLLATMRDWVERAACAMCEFPERFEPIPAAIAHRKPLTFASCAE